MLKEMGGEKKLKCEKIGREKYSILTLVHALRNALAK